MKKLIILFAVIAASVSSSLANTDPIAKPVAIIENSSITVTIDAKNVDLFTIAEYENDNLEFETNSNISYIQIFNSNGDLEFQLPVMTNRVKIGKSLIGKGNYILGFMIEGVSDIQFTDVYVK